jgi:hypothetical protein
MTTVLLIVCVIGTLTAHFGLSQGYWYALLYLTGTVLVVSGIHYLYQALVYLSQHVPELFS